jgi:DNA-directed RNA polymerase I, II, and III subunit RPABC3
MANQLTDSQLFDDTFKISDIDHKKYDRVGRLTAESTSREIKFTLDVNTDIFPCEVGETLHLVLASTLSIDGRKEDGKGWRETQSGEPSLADGFDYVCHGKVYRFEEASAENMYVRYRLVKRYFRL